MKLALHLMPQTYLLRWLNETRTEIHKRQLTMQLQWELYLDHFRRPCNIYFAAISANKCLYVRTMSPTATDAGGAVMATQMDWEVLHTLASALRSICLSAPLARGALGDHSSPLHHNFGYYIFVCWIALKT